MIRAVASLTAAAVLYAFTSVLAQAPESAPALTPPPPAPALLLRLRLWKGRKMATGMK